MFGKLLKSTVGIVGDVVNVVSAPVVIAVEVTRAATKPIGDAMKEVAEDVQDGMGNDND